MRISLLLFFTILFLSACQSDKDIPNAELPYTPPAVSFEEDRCCRAVLALFEKNQNDPLPDSVFACVERSLEGLPPGFPVTLLRLDTIDSQRVAERPKSFRLPPSDFRLLSNARPLAGFPETEVRCRYALAYQESAKGNVRKSNDIMLEAETLLAGRNNSMADSLRANMYNLISINYQSQFEYTRTLAFSEQAASLYRKLEAWESLANELINQAVCYQSVGDARAAAEKLGQAESLLAEKVPNPGNTLIRLNLENNRILLSMRRGDYYKRFHWPEKAMTHYAGALQEMDSLLAGLELLAQKDAVYQKPYVITQFSKAALLSKLVDSLGSRPFLEQAEATLSFFGEPRWDFRQTEPISGYILLMMSRALSLQGRLEEARRYLRLALIRLGYPNDSLLESPPVEVGLIPRHDFLLSGLQTKGEVMALCYEATGERQYLEAALNNYRQGLIYLDSIRILTADDAAVDSARRLADGIVSNAIRTAYQLYLQEPSQARLAQLFQLAEQGKSYAVRQAVFRQMGFLEFEGEMQQLLQREQHLRRSLQRYKEEGQGFQDSVVQATRQYEAFIDSLRVSRSPAWRAYYRERFSNEAIGLEQAQGLLDDTTAILSFVHGPGAGLCFVITRAKAEVLALSMDDGRIARQASALKENLQTGSTAAFADNASQLYRLAFADPLRRLPAGIRSLVIVPDGALHGLPFECLIMEKTSGRPLAESSYLADRYWVSYAYSVEVYDHLKKLPEEEKKWEIGAFLAEYAAGEAQDSPLRCADTPLREMAGQSRSIIRTFKSKGYATSCDEKAGEAVFKKRAGACRILHFSAHGCAEASQARDYAILFTQDGRGGQDGNLRSGEILSLDLYGTALAVLSMCDTHYGINQPGEGLASIARAFSIAGCSSLLASTFKALEPPTAEITASFYDHLLKGAPKDVALALAKRQYRQRHPQAEPASWAPLILIGNNKALY